MSEHPGKYAPNVPWEEYVRVRDEGIETRAKFEEFKRRAYKMHEIRLQLEGELAEAQRKVRRYQRGEWILGGLLALLVIANWVTRYVSG